MAYPDYEAARQQAIKEISSLGHEAYWDSQQLKTKAGTPIDIIIDRHGNKQYTFVNSQGKKYAFSSNGKFVPVVSKSQEEWNKVDKERTDTSRQKKEDNKSWWQKLGPYVAPGQITGIVETAQQASNIPYKQVNGKYAQPTAQQTKDAKNALTIGSIAAPIATVAGAVLPAVAPGTIGGNIIGDIAGWEAVNKTSDLLTGKTFGGHIRSGIGLIPGANEFLYSSSYLSTPYEMFTDIVGNPMSYNTVRTAVGKGVDKVYTGIQNSVQNFQNRYFFVPRSYSYTRGIGRGTEGLNDLMTTGIVRGNPRGTEVTANSFAKLYRKNRDHFRDIMQSTGISNIESKFFSRNLTEEEFNAIKEASKNYTKPRLSKNLETIYVQADPLERYSTYAAYINDINKTVKEVELMPSRIQSGEIKVNPTLTNQVDSNIPTGLPIEERFGTNSDYIGDGTPLAYFYSDGRNPLTQGYDYAGSDYGVRINNPQDYTPFLHELHLHPSFFNAPKLSDPNVELFGRGPFGLTLKLDKTTGKPLLFQEPVNFFRNIFSLTSNVRRPTIYSLGLSSQQRGSISDELFLRGKQLEDALKGNVIANITQGHGMSKGQTIEDLEQLLTNGIDKNRSWFSAPLDVEMGGSGFGTASGKPYTDGPFIVIGYPNDPSWSKGIQGILYNDAQVNGYNYQDIINYMKNKYPQFKHMTYDEYAKEIGGTIPQQYLANNYNNSFNIVSKSDNQLSALPDEIVLDMNPTTKEVIKTSPEYLQFQETLNQGNKASSQINYDIIANRNKIGNIDLIVNHKNHTINVAAVNINQKGNGQQIYKQISSMFPEYTLKSDPEALSDDAIHMWDALVRKGNARKLGDKQYEMINSSNYSSWTPQQWDNAYNAAIQSGNMDEVQRLRDLHFKVSYPDTKIVDAEGKPIHAYHGTASKFNIFDPNQIGRLDPGYYYKGFYFTPEKEVARGYAQAQSNYETIPTYIMDTYLNITNPIKINSNDLHIGEWIPKPNNGVKVVLGEIGPDDIILDNTVKYNPDELIEIVASKSSQIKSADPITYDDAGNIIPLSQRDNSSSPDIRYSWMPWLLGGGIGTNFLLNNGTSGNKTN